MENRISKALGSLLCAFVLSFTVTSVNAQFCTFTTQDVACNGEATGIITFNPTGGTEPYDYAWSHNPVINTNQVLNLPAGVYNITVSDAVGAQEICTVEIVEPTPITITNVIEVDPMCGLMDGSFEIEAVPQSGGSASDLMYSIDGGASFQTSNLFTDLGPDDYLIIVADVNGCFIVESRQLVDATSVTIDLNSAMCDGGGTVTIDITANGGTTPYTYLWSNGATVEDLMGVVPGNYIVTVTDREGCEAVGDYTVDSCCDISMFCNATITNTSCNGIDDGAITVTPTGGLAPYTYAWSHDAGLTSDMALNLPGGFYNVTITDANNCESICGFDVIEPSALVITDILSINPMCGASDGELTILADAPSNMTLSDLSYSIDGGVSFQASNVFQNLTPGNYNVVAADLNGCFDSQVASLMDAGGVSVNLIDAGCISGSTISISVMGSGGVAPLNYTWTGNMGFTNPSPNVLEGPQGTYTVVVTDANGCTAELTHTQDSCCDSGMFCTSTVQNATCNGATNGSVTVAPNGGVAPYTFAWSHDASINVDNATNLAAGFYMVTVADASGCSAVCGIEITEPSAIVIDDVTSQNPMCGMDDGAILIDASPKSGSGCSDLEYSIDGGMTFQVSNQFVDLGAGDYLVIVRDCDDCVAVQSAQLLDGAGINVAFTTDCANSLVDIDLTATGGVAPYTFAWIGPNGFNATTEDVIGGPTGTYNVTVTDSNGCQGFAMITQDMCCQLQASCPPNVMDVPCGNFSEIPAEFLNSDPDGGNDVVVFAAMGGTIDAFPVPCGDITITASDDLTGTGCLNDPYLLVRTFTITDGVTSIDCGMMMMGANNELPMIDVQASDLTVDCPDDINQAFSDWLNSNGGASASDDCSTVTWTNDWTTGGTVEFGTTYTVTFIASDDCGNVAMTIASFDAIACPQGGDFSGTVWEDINGDGVQDPGQPTFESIAITLFTAEGVIVSTVFTNSAGGYIFEDVPHGEYILHFGIDNEYSFTLPNVGTDSGDSDVDNGNGYGTTSIINHTGGDRVFDAGIHKCVPVGELVWFDTNMNDQWDLAENGINGMQVIVWKQGLSAGFFQYDYTHTGPKPGTPSDDGYYKFCLPPGTYYLEFKIPPFGLVPVISGVGGSNNDSDVTAANGANTTSTFSIVSGEERCDIGAGYYPMATIGNNIFFDDNSNGLADPGEFGMSDVTVELYNANDHSMIESQTTDAQGSYLFDYLGKDDYYLKVIPPDNYLVTTAHVGTDENMDSDVDNSNGPNTTAMYTLTPGMELDNVDIGLVEGTVVAVDWVKVAAENRGDHNHIDWTVAFQNNTSHYEVERKSIDENSFRAIGKVEANDEISQQDYEYQDFDIENASLVYYRVVEYDINGYVSYSDVVVVNTNVSRAPKISIAPNPFVSELTIEIDTPVNTNASIVFWDASGRQVELNGFEEGNISSGMNRITYDWSSMPPGVYSAQIVVNGNQFIKKLIKIE